MLGLKNRKGTPVSGGIAILHHHVHPRRHRDASRAATQAVERIHRTHMETRSRSQEVDDPAKRDEAVDGAPWRSSSDAPTHLRFSSHNIRRCIRRKHH